MQLVDKVKNYASKIMKIYKLEEMKQKKFRKVYITQNNKVILDDRIHAGFIVEDKPKSIVAESYRTLRTNIQYSSFDREIKTLAITSAEMAEGKSTVAGNIAASFAQVGKNVILVDCDLRKPSIHKKFKVSNLLGVSEVILGKASFDEAVQRRSDNFYFLTSGKIPPNPSEMLASSAMMQLIERLKIDYDMVIIDTAPLRAVTDAQIISKKVDGIILVVRASCTKKEVVMEAKKLLEQVNANILGTVLHAVENTRGKYYAYYGSNEDEDN